MIYTLLEVLFFILLITATFIIAGVSIIVAGKIAEGIIDGKITFPEDKIEQQDEPYHFF